MAKQKLKQLEPNKIGSAKWGFDGEEDGWVFVKKQRVIIVLPSLPLPEHYTPEKPVTSQSPAQLRDDIADTQETTPAHTLTLLPSLPLPEHFILQNPAISQSQAELITETHKATLVHSVVPSLPVTEHCTLQKPATSQSHAELRAEIVHTVVPSLVLPEHCVLQKYTTSQSRPELRDMVADTHETTHFHAMQPEACPDFTSVDKPEIVKGNNLTTRKTPAPIRSLQDHRPNPGTRVSSSLEIHRSHTARNPIRFSRVMCSNVVMDNEKLRVLNLERKVEKAGGLNEWVGSIGLGREFERMLRGQRMNKFQVANLTMEKLKQMGALAVGPRRKLIHAIRCVYEPHCLRAYFN